VNIEALDDTIIALATPQGVGAIALIRLSGKDAIEIVNSVFKGKNLEKQATHTVHFGTICKNDELLDEVLVSIFAEPNSFTKQNTVEIACHGSPFIVQEIIHLFLEKGVRLAQAGEFTKRAFLNGRFDLAQAEAVADLIASDSKAARQTALNQMRGGFSTILKDLREKLVYFAALIELELDFGEEDVEFADRKKLKELVVDILQIIGELIDSFRTGNAIKNGVPTVIIGKPNAGKSTLLNALLNEEKAMVSHIAGTTRDFIEDQVHIGGINFRFIDTAGLRDTQDQLEAMGVERTRQKMKQAALLIYLFDPKDTSQEEFEAQLLEIKALEIPFLKVANKMDLEKNTHLESDIIQISAQYKQNLDFLKEQLLKASQLQHFSQNGTIITNLRHLQHLQETQNSLQFVLAGLQNGTTGDFVAMDIRHALRHLGQITGQIDTDRDILGAIFSKFCIGK